VERRPDGDRVSAATSERAGAASSRVAASDLRPADLVPWLLTAAGPSGPLDEVAVSRGHGAPDGSVTLAGRGSLFDVVATWTPLRDVARPAQAWSVELDITLDPAVDAPVEASVAAAIAIPADVAPDWLIPGLFYGENRPSESTARYPRWIENVEDASADPFAAPDWWFRSDRSAIPAVLATGGGLRAAIATRPTTPTGLAGIGFGPFGEASARRELRLSFPYREEPCVYDGSSGPQRPDLATATWLPGRSIRFAYRVDIEPDGPDASAQILRRIRAWLAPDAFSARPPIGAAETAALAAEGLVRWHFRDEDDVLIETAAFERHGDGTALEPGDRLAMHVAWVSGAPSAASLLAHGLRTGNAVAADAGRRVLDAIASNLAPCGTFWGQWTAEDGWGKGWTPGPDALHARTLAEAALFMARAARLERAPAWREAIAMNSAFVVRAQRSDGSIPAAWHGRTGEPLSWAGTAGLAWVSALTEAAVLLDDSSMIEAAGRAGDFYAADVAAGTLRGAPEDVDLGPTSEDGYAAVMAYVALARAARDDAERFRWIDLARRAADWMLTFRYAYDVAFPPGSTLDRIGFRTLGGDMASPANQHLHAYGLICTGELLELAAWTGDRSYADRARETFACFRQGIARHDGDLGARRGMAPERWFQTRYDGAKGEIGRLSHAWCLGLLLHAAEVALEHPELTADG
jgi:hypothetical protein